MVKKQGKEVFMNDETQKISPLDEKKKSALIHYVAILFIVAFIVVLLSMLGTMRHSREDITELTNEIMATAGAFAQRKGVVFA
jgi:hypothetical protein